MRGSTITHKEGDNSYHLLLHRQHNGQKKEGKQRSTKHTHKTVDLVTRTPLNRFFFVNNEEWPECIPCISNYSLNHVLIDCVDVVDTRQTFYNVDIWSFVFTNATGDTILKLKKKMSMLKYKCIRRA